MENEKGSTLDFLNNINKPDVFKEEVKDEVVEEVVEEEKPLPFFKDPKVQRFIDKQVEKRMKDFQPSAEQQFRKEVSDEVNLPSSFIKLVGNDTDEKKQVLKDLSEYFGTLKGEARKEFLTEMQEQQEEVAAQDRAAVEELQTAFEEIEETFGVDLTSNTAQAQKLDNDFRTFIRKIAPKDADGDVKEFPDLISAFEEFQERNKKTSQPTRAKELASRGLTRSNDTVTGIPQGKSWKDVERYFNKLKADN